MTPLDLFSNPVAHRRDPAPSHEAAEAITDSGARGRQAEQVLALVRALPGRTAGELASESRCAIVGGQRMPLDRVQVARRLSDLKAAGHVRIGDARLCSIANRRASTWWPT